MAATAVVRCESLSLAGCKCKMVITRQTLILFDTAACVLPIALLKDVATLCVDYDYV